MRVAVVINFEAPLRRLPNLLLFCVENYACYDLPRRKHEMVAVNILDAIIKIACSNTNELFIADPTVIANI